MADLITYDDKVKIADIPAVPDINKFRDSDANEIKSVVNVNAGELDVHVADLANPHQVTATQLGLGNVDNTSDADKPISDATQAALDLKVDGDNTSVDGELAKFLGTDGKVIQSGTGVFATAGALASDSYVAGSPTDGDKGIGTINAEQIYIDGEEIFANTSLIKNNTTDTWEAPPTDDGQVQNIGQEIFVNGVNETGAPLTTVNPKVMVANAGSGEFMDFELALSDGIEDGAVYGLNTTAAGIGANFKLTTYGLVNGVDTSSWPAGTSLYVSDNTAGGLTSTKPSSNVYPVGVVTFSHVSAGIIMVNTIRITANRDTNIAVNIDTYNFTADDVVTSEGTFFEALRNAVGTNASDMITISGMTDVSGVQAGDKDLLVYASDLGNVIKAGVYSAQFEMELSGTTDGDERVFLEMYLTDADGAPINPGTGNPAGSLGVPTILVMESLVQNLPLSIATIVRLEGFLAGDVTVGAGERVRYVCLGEKVGGGAAAKTYTINVGTDHQSRAFSPSALVLNDLFDVEVTGAMTGNSLVYDGSIWQASTLTLQDVTEGGNTTGEDITVGALSATTGAFGGDVTVSTTTATGLNLTRTSNGNVTLNIRNTANDISITQLTFGDSSSSNPGRLIYDHSINQMDFYTSGSSKLSIDSNGNATFAGDVTGEQTTTFRNLNPEGQTDGEIALKFEQTQNFRSGGRIVAGREQDYSSGANRDSYLSFQTAEGNVDGEALRLASNKNATFAGDVILAGSGKYLIIDNPDETPTGLRIRDAQSQTSQWGEFGFDASTQETYIGRDDGADNLVKMLTFNESTSAAKFSGEVAIEIIDTSTTLPVGNVSQILRLNNLNDDTVGTFADIHLQVGSGDAHITAIREASNTAGLRFATDNNGTTVEALTLAGNGNATFGGDVTVSTTTATGLNLNRTSNGNVTLNIRNTANDTSITQLTFGDSSSSNPGRLVYDHSINQMDFYTSGSSKLSIDSNGNATFGGDVNWKGTDGILTSTGSNIRIRANTGIGVQIGANNVSNHLVIDTSGNATFSSLAGAGTAAVEATAAGTLQRAVSDESLKMETGAVPGLGYVLKAAEATMAFRFLEEAKNHPDMDNWGFGAQMVTEAYGESPAFQMYEGLYQWDYKQMIAPLYVAIKELNEELNELRNKLN